MRNTGRIVCLVAERIKEHSYKKSAVTVAGKVWGCRQRTQTTTIRGGGTRGGTIRGHIAQLHKLGGRGIDAAALALRHGLEEGTERRRTLAIDVGRFLGAPRHGALAVLVDNVVADAAGALERAAIVRAHVGQNVVETVARGRDAAGARQWTRGTGRRTRNCGCACWDLAIII